MNSQKGLRRNSRIPVKISNWIAGGTPGGITEIFFKEKTKVSPRNPWRNFWGCHWRMNPRRNPRKMSSTPGRIYKEILQWTHDGNIEGIPEKIHEESWRNPWADSKELTGKYFEGTLGVFSEGILWGESVEIRKKTEGFSWSNSKNNGWREIPRGFHREIFRRILGGGISRGILKIFSEKSFEEFP